MVKAVIFDLDGTLVQTEILKAESYSRAAVQLAGESISETEVMAAFVEVVGRSRREVSGFLLQRFGLEQAAAKRMSEFGVATPCQAFVQVRLQIYNRMLEDPMLLKKHRCPYNLTLLHKVREEGYRTGLATMSHCEQTGNVLRILDIADLFDFIATRDDVETGKPDPEIYLLITSQLMVDPGDCLVIEDSVAGIKAALAAGMHCIAVTNEFTLKPVTESHILDKRWIVSEPKNLVRIAGERISELER